MDFKSGNKIYNDQLVTIGDLEEFKQDLLISLVQIVKANVAKPIKKWLKSYEVKELLGISHGTLQILRSNGTLPFTKIGNIMYYDPEDIEKMLSEKKRHNLKGMQPPKKSNIA
jgi:hypothetical protein